MVHHDCILCTQENDALRSKDRELHDKMTDMRSKVAILSADKERLYQEKSDLGERMEKQNLINKQLQEVCKSPVYSSRIELE